MGLESVDFEQVADGLRARVVLPPLSGGTEFTIPAGAANEMRARQAALSVFRAAWPEIEPHRRLSLSAATERCGRLSQAA
jgi:hypothetical protein